MSEFPPDAILLAGGSCTRLANYCLELPEPLIPAAGRRLLYWVSRWLTTGPVASLTFSVDYRAEQIEGRAVAHGESLSAPMRCVRDVAPSGTGGAAHLCLADTGSNILVYNGDSLVLTDLAPAVAYFRTNNIDSLIVAISEDDAKRYGTLNVDDNGRLQRIEEKRRLARVRLINAGVYLFRRSLLNVLTEGVPLSLEQEILPRSLRQGAAIGVWSPGDRPFLDTGIPDLIIEATAFIKNDRGLLIAFGCGLQAATT